MALSDQNLPGYQPRSFRRHSLCKRAASLASKVLCLHIVTGGVMFVTAITYTYSQYYMIQYDFVKLPPSEVSL